MELRDTILSVVGVAGVINVNTLEDVLRRWAETIRADWGYKRTPLGYRSSLVREEISALYSLGFLERREFHGPKGHVVQYALTSDGRKLLATRREVNFGQNVISTSLI